MVPGTGLEPALPFGNLILSQKRLPFRHPGNTAVTLRATFENCEPNQSESMLSLARSRSRDHVARQ